MSKIHSLAQAAKQGDALGVQLALEAGADPRDNSSYALRVAASNGSADCVKLLIPVSDPLSVNSLALRWAAENGHDHCVELLIPVSDPQKNDSGALRAAAAYAHAGCVALLLPFSDLNSVEGAVKVAKHRGHMEVAGMIESFMEAAALSESCPKTNRSKDNPSSIKSSGLSL